jgi:predicted Zn-dependent protease
VLNNLAWVAGQMKDPKAIEYAEKANKLAPNQPALMDTLAVLLMDKGDTHARWNCSRRPWNWRRRRRRFVSTTPGR